MYNNILSVSFHNITGGRACYDHYANDTWPSMETLPYLIHNKIITWYLDTRILWCVCLFLSLVVQVKVFFRFPFYEFINQYLLQTWGHFFLLLSCARDWGPRDWLNSSVRFWGVSISTFHGRPVYFIFLEVIKYTVCFQIFDTTQKVFDTSVRVCFQPYLCSFINNVIHPYLSIYLHNDFCIYQHTYACFTIKHLDKSCSFFPFVFTSVIKCFLCDYNKYHPGLLYYYHIWLYDGAIIMVSIYGYVAIVP